MSDMAEPLNRELRGFTNVISFALNYDDVGTYDLRLELANIKEERIALFCRDVSGLSCAKFGGGLSQFMFLYARDVRNEQMDRVVLNFTEREHESIVFNCAAAEVQQLTMG